MKVRDVLLHIFLILVFTSLLVLKGLRLSDGLTKYQIIVFVLALFLLVLQIRKSPISKEIFNGFLAIILFEKLYLMFAIIKNEYYPNLAQQLSSNDDKITLDLTTIFPVVIAMILTVITLYQYNRSKIKKLIFEQYFVLLFITVTIVFRLI